MTAMTDERLRAALAGALADLAYIVWGPGRGFDQPEGSRSPDGVTWTVPSKVRALLDEAALAAAEAAPAGLQMEHHPSCCGACDECLRICPGYHGPERRSGQDRRVVVAYEKAR
jgi:hypothetical protein